ncbi:transmembrane protein 255B isoform X2 [Denticeps clupeoides]|uniref:Transmembrane protein 255B n=1 Tax=Denticeps clupeoides TaxID=299321 RepID=A0AAY4CPU8_9TELE|nr:transmembrane protein 255B-like isoform X2 [Denticeps clupeoides]
MAPAATRDTVDGDPRSAEVLRRKRRMKALWLVAGMLCLSLLTVALGVYTTTRTESLSITGYSSGVILAFGSFLGLLGLCLEENRKQLLVASIVFLSFGIIGSALCVLVDGVFILLGMDIRPLKAGRCQFYTSGNSYIYENYYASVPCQGLVESCTMRVRSGTCYCCDLYDCANGGYLNTYYEFVGVRSCQEVFSLYVCLWVLTALNVLTFILGILTTAVLGSIKDLKVSPFAREGVSAPLLPPREPVIFPTAPQLMDPNTHSSSQLYPKGSLYFTPSAMAVGVSQPGPSDKLQPDPNPPPFAPLYSLLPYKTPG